MNQTELNEIIDGITSALKEHIDELTGRITVLEGKAAVVPAAGKDGKDADLDAVKKFVTDAVAALPAPQNGKDGKDADPVQIQALVDAAVKALPAPKNGDNGKDGRDVTPDELNAAIAAHVERSVAKIPVPQNGTSVTVADVAPIIAAEVEKAVKALPVPKNGENGKDGKDGVGIVDPLVDQDGVLVFAMTDGTLRKAGRVRGNDGAQGPKGDDGKDGADGFGYDDLEESVEDDGRVLVRTYKRGDRVKAFRHQQSIVLDRGVFADGKSYQRGDGVTWGGSFWIAQAETTAKPGLATPESRAWRLAVKRGSDGKEGRAGKDGAPGPKGDKGDKGYGG